MSKRDQLLSPYEISEIKNVNAYTIDNKLFDLILVKNRQLINSGSVFEDHVILRSIVNRFIDNANLPNLLYEKDPSDKRICFIVEYSSERKFLITFDFSEIGLNNVENSLQFIKSKQEAIIEWFAKQVDSKRNLVIEDFRVFPRYETPLIEAILSFEDKILGTKIQSVSLFTIIHQANEEIEFEFQNINSINLALGNNNYNLKVKKSKLMKKNMYTSHLEFTNLKNFHSWLQFIIAMQLRLKKSLS